MEKILEVRKQLDEINFKYDLQVKELKLKIAEIEAQRQEELGDLQSVYDALKQEIIDSNIVGTYVKIPGVTIRKNKSVIITDESLIPEMYHKTIIDDKKIKADLKESDYTLEIPGVVVEEKYTIAI